MAGKVSTNGASRAVSLVEFLAARPTDTFSLSEIARRLGFNKSTTHTLVHTLHQAGWLFYSPRTRTYGLGPRLTMLGEAASESMPEASIAGPFMTELVSEIQGECVLSTVTGDQILVLASTGPATLGQASLHPGSFMPLNPPFGTVFMAWMDDLAREQWLARGGASQADRASALEEELAVIRKRGYVATIRASSSAEISSVMRDIDDRSMSQVEFRAAIEQRLAEMSPAGYLMMDAELQREPQWIDSIQVPIFRPGSNLLALTLGHINRHVNATQLKGLVDQVRRVADAITDALDGVDSSEETRVL